MPSKILVVDDDLRLAHLAAQMLEQHGYKVVAVSSPGLALELLACFDGFGLLIADVRMEDLSGFELARAAREERPRLPVLFISGYVEPDYAGQGGFVDFLAKPFTAEELGAAVRRMLAP